ncbi:MAG: hypothetical protein ABR510_11280 [Trueperaceae bacterium]
MKHVDALPNGFSHRDDEQPRPLAEALDLGFRFVEMDVWYVFGRVLVAHDPQDLRPWNTLQRLYLDPLRALQRDGRIGGQDPIWLFVDTKTRANPMHGALERLARAYDDVVADPASDQDERPVRLLLTGNRPSYERLERTPERRTALDGRLPDVGVRTDVRMVPVISDHWKKHFAWRGVGPMPEAERTRLRGLVATAHASGQRVRFWATPDAPGPERDAVWATLLDEGVNLINTDDLHGLASFLRSRQPATS